ncbi:MAG: GNAT family N-acetyltransferase [Novosphingobium sp.]|uniref:N-acetyltransferase n=1 Tax=Novosphingobium indicum TaxID=462949 RepID=A0ABQ2J9A7_9SPHN|nr:GNAT family N-acetyltransferase [Novosphingobium indicum]MAC58745.1 GNAT family N-acetyltransferase [Novosphingobium sp.]GGN41097.1 N-acetyltransferase [Novosphingobium indicum]
MTDGPFLTTERLELWKPQAGDLPDRVRLLEGDGMMQFLGTIGPDPKAQHDKLLQHAGSWALYDYGTFSVRRRGEGDIIATGGIFHSWRGFGKGLDDVAEAGWIVRQDCWGQGVAGEMMRASLAWFDTAHGPRRVACMIEAGNTASEKVAGSLGFVKYDSHEEEGGAAVNLFERLPG